MRAYNKLPIPHRKKVLLDRKYRQRNLKRLQAYDRKRSKTLARRAAMYGYGRLFKENNAKHVLEYSQAYYQKNKKKWAEKIAKRRAKFTKEEWRDIQRRYGLKHRHGITVEEYDALLKRQGGHCALCPAKPGEYGQNGRLHVDHCHETGKNRGLLCNRCNHAIERLDSNPDWGRKAEQYRQSFLPHQIAAD
jgi:hypothetical protein